MFIWGIKQLEYPKYLVEESLLKFKYFPSEQMNELYVEIHSATS